MVICLTSNMKCTYATNENHFIKVALSKRKSFLSIFRSTPYHSPDIDMHNACSIARIGAESDIK